MAESDERTIHRLEAFSDVVMGFCLAEIGLNLAIPKDVAGLASLWPSLNAFAFSFYLIAELWWSHHKLFANYVALNPPTIVMNFVMLAALALGIYFQQVAVHFLAANVVPVVPLQLWLACMAVVYALLAAMYGLGIWQRRAELDAEVLSWGVKRTYRAMSAAIVLVGVCFVFPTVARNGDLSVAMSALLMAIVLLGRFVSARVAEFVIARR